MHRSMPGPAVRAEARRSRPAPGCSPLRPSRSRRPRSGRARCTEPALRRGRCRRRWCERDETSSPLRTSPALGRSSGWPRARARTREIRRRTPPARTAGRRCRARATCAVEHSVLAQRVRDDHLDRRLRCRRAAAGAACRPMPGRGRGRPPETRSGELQSTSSAPCSASASSTPPPRHAPLIAATVGNGSARSRPNSSCPARAPSIARSRVMSGNSVMSAPAAKKNGLPVITAAR